MQSLACPIADPVLVGLLPARPRNFVEIDHDMFSMVILLLWLIEDGQHMWSVTRENMCSDFLTT